MYNTLSLLGQQRSAFYARTFCQLALNKLGLYGRFLTDNFNKVGQEILRASGRVGPAGKPRTTSIQGFAEHPVTLFPVSASRLMRRVSVTGKPELVSGFTKKVLPVRRVFELGIQRDAWRSRQSPRPHELTLYSVMSAWASHSTFDLVGIFLLLFFFNDVQTPSLYRNTNVMCYYDQKRWRCGYWRWGRFIRPERGKRRKRGRGRGVRGRRGIRDGNRQQIWNMRSVGSMGYRVRRPPSAVSTPSP